MLIDLISSFWCWIDNTTQRTIDLHPWLALLVWVLLFFSVTLAVSVLAAALL